MTIQISNVAAKAGLDAITALLNAGGTGSLVIYSGTKPTDVDTALGANTALATFALNSTAFAAAVDGAPNAVATANAISDVVADAGGSASFFRLFNNGGTAVIQGTVTATGGGGDCTITSTTVVAAGPCSVTSLVLTNPE